MTPPRPFEVMIGTRGYLVGASGQVRMRMSRKVRTMTTLLERAFAEAAKLSSAEQDLLASRLLAELVAEDEFDRAIAASGEKLARLATEALAEHRAGLTEDLDPDRL